MSALFDIMSDFQSDVKEMLYFKLFLSYPPKSIINRATVRMKNIQFFSYELIILRGVREMSAAREGKQGEITLAIQRGKILYPYQKIADRRLTVKGNRTIGICFRYKDYDRYLYIYFNICRWLVETFTSRHRHECLPTWLYSLHPINPMTFSHGNT